MGHNNSCNRASFLATARVVFKGIGTIKRQSENLI
jgi:hypothetical protein